jgi:hypothetical protein
LIAGQELLEPKALDGKTVRRKEAADQIRAAARLRNWRLILFGD